MPSLGMPELIIIMVIILLVFGAGRLSEVGASLGRGIREFRNATADLGNETRPSTPAPAPAPVPTVAPAPAQSPALAARGAACRGCGQALMPGANFCANCGTRVEPLAAPGEPRSA